MGLLATFDEAYLFDVFSVLEIKHTKYAKDSVIYASCVKLFDELCEQLGTLLIYDVLKSSEYENLRQANLMVFERIDEMRKRERTGEDARFIDDKNYERYLWKKKLQEKFFPKTALSEKKFGYD